ncbi:MAG: hypothetical protein QOD02_3776, partial [Mycobacterium sp.]|nr:hypothetical protein [Mycobacterium sp.]
TAPCLADLVPDDLARILGMLTSTLWTMDPGGHGWRRCLALICEGLTSAKAGPLPPPRKLLNTPRSGGLGPPTTGRHCVQLVEHDEAPGGRVSPTTAMSSYYNATPSF